MTQTPRNTLQGTRAEALLRRDFYGTYLQARYVAGEDMELPNAAAVFTPDGIQQLRQHLTEMALQAPVVLTERLSNRVLAVHLVQNHVERFVVVNTRMKVDPDVLVHTLMEDYVHSQQVLDSIDFEQQMLLVSFSTYTNILRKVRTCFETMASASCASICSADGAPCRFPGSCQAHNVPPGATEGHGHRPG